MPLEIQLETYMAGQMQGQDIGGKIDEIIRMLTQHGYRRPLLEWALRSERKKTLSKLLAQGTGSRRTRG